jgi:hypothetical protein
MPFNPDNGLVTHIYLYFSSEKMRLSQVISFAQGQLARKWRYPV